MWRKDFTGKIHTTFSPLRLTDIARYVKRTDRIPHIRIGSCGAWPDVPPHRLTICRPLPRKKRRAATRARMVWLRRVKSALRPHGLPPHEKRYASVVSSRRIKSALRTRAPPWPVVACSECATARALSCRSPLRRSTRAHIFLRKPRKQCENVLQTPERVI